MTKQTEALAEQPAQQEPVAWIDEFGNVFPLGAQRGPKYLNEPMKPLYTSPPPQRTWVGLTDDEIWKDDAIMSANSGYGATFDTLRDMVRAVEAKLKEKNQ